METKGCWLKLTQAKSGRLLLDVDKSKKWLFVVGCEKWLCDITQNNNQAWPY